MCIACAALGLCRRNILSTIGGIFSSFLSLLPVYTFHPEGVVQGSEIFNGHLTQKNIRIPLKKELGTPFPPHFVIFGWKQRVF